MTEIEKGEQNLSLFVKGMQDSALEAIIQNSPRLYQVRCVELSEVFNRSVGEIEFDPNKIQSLYDFISTYGNLVTIDQYNRTESVFWNPKNFPEEMFRLVTTLNDEVSRARIVDRYFSTRLIWGEEGEGRVNVDMSLAEQVDPEVLHDEIAKNRVIFRVVTNLMTKSDPETIEFFLSMFEKHSPVFFEKAALFLSKVRSLTTQFKRIVNPVESYNFMWQVATGFSEEDYETFINVIDPISAHWEENKDVAAFENYLDVMADYKKNAPMRFVQPEYNDEEADFTEFLDSNGYRTSLERRHARLDEIALLWSPRQSESAVEAKRVIESPLKISWSEFRSRVLGEAKRIEVFVTDDTSEMIGVTTASNPLSPPILLWDREGYRNPFSWYSLPRSTPHVWGLKPNTWQEVSGISLTPNMFNSLGEGGKLKGAVLYLKNARPYHKTELGLFTNILNDDFVGFESCIREYSQRHRLIPSMEANATGYLVGKTKNPMGGSTIVRVEAEDYVASYIITHW